MSNKVQYLVEEIDLEQLAQEMYSMITQLFPTCRSITGNGIRKTLSALGNWVDLDVHEVPTGYQAFDWTVPKEWNIRDAYVKDPNGIKVIDFNENNLHVLNYSAPISSTMSFKDLQSHLYWKPELPNAIPYLTSYYENRWGFCLTKEQLDEFQDVEYEVSIDSSLDDGHLTFADGLIHGTSPKEILFSTYCCHPSLANDNLSGPVLTAMLQRLLAECQLRYSYRFVYVPETIGTLVYLSQHHEHLLESLDAGYVVTCVGDNGPFTYKRSRIGISYADKVAEHCLKYIDKSKQISIIDFVPTGSDERQYCSPGFNLPIGSLMRSMYGTYPEYHTSLDNLQFVSAEGLKNSLIAYLRIIQVHELNRKYINLMPYGEPQLGRRGLVPTLGELGMKPEAETRQRYLLAFSDGSTDLVDIAQKADQPAWTFGPEITSLIEAGLLGLAE